VINVLTPDRNGLLRDICATISAAGLSINYARIVTENGTVHNEFHVSSGNSGGQIPEESWDNLKEMISESVTVGVGQANRTQHSEKKWKKDFGELPKLISCTVGRRKSKAMYFVENSSDVAGLMHAFAEVVTRENGGHPHVCADAAMCPNPRGG